MKRLVSALATVVAALAIAAGPAAAGEIPGPESARTDAPVVAPLTRDEAKRVTKYLLQRLIGPAVSSTTDPPQLNGAWGCRTPRATAGRCRGAVRAGDVTCRGVFRVRKFAAGYAAYPLWMRCTT